MDNAEYTERQKGIRGVEEKKSCYKIKACICCV